LSAPTKPIRVLLADDHAIARAGVAALLSAQRDVELCGQAEDGAAAVRLYDALRPDVLVIDLRMPVLDGVGAITAICRQHPEAHVLVLSHFDGDENVVSALRAGARGYVTKDARGEMLVEAVRTIAAGGRYLPPDLAGQLVGRVNQNPLSGRERQVLDHLVDGLTNREIGEALGITERTIALHVSNLLVKLGAKTRTEAATLALQRGLVSRR
jgi:two-component system, NarL family, response regulator